MKKQLRLTAFLALLTFVSFGQDVKWTAPQKSEGFVSRIESEGDGNFYAIKADQGMAKTRYLLARYENYQLVACEQAPGKVPTGKGDPKQLLMIEGKPYVFIADNSKGMTRLFLQECNRLCQPVGEARQIMETPDPKGFFNRALYSIKCSENYHYALVVVYTLDFKEKIVDRKYSVLDVTSNYEKIAEGQLTSDIKNDSYEFISSDFITNTGDYFAIADAMKKEKDEWYLQERKLITFTNNGEDEIPLDLPDGYSVSNLTFSSDNFKILSIIGSYSQNGEGTSGMFCAKYDFAHRKMLVSNYRAFTKEDLSENPNFDEENEKQSYDAALKNMYISELIACEGGLLCILESQHQWVTTMTSSDGSTTQFAHYKYGRLIVVKFSHSGKFDWVCSIPKSQLSTNDQGKFSSYFAYLDNGNLEIFFVDDIGHYSADGSYLKDVKVTKKMSPRNFLLAAVAVSLADGSAQRKAFITTHEEDLYEMPKSFAVDYENSQVILYKTNSKGSKESFGFIKI